MKHQEYLSEWERDKQAAITIGVTTSLVVFVIGLIWELAR